MPLPPNVREAIDSAAPSLPGRPAVEECQGAKFHSPRPMILHETPVGSGDVVLLCGTCRDNLAVLEALQESTEEALPGPLRREWGNVIRALAGA
jgi:hypothetical protein